LQNIEFPQALSLGVGGTLCLAVLRLVFMHLKHRDIMMQKTVDALSQNIREQTQVLHSIKDQNRSHMETTKTLCHEIRKMKSEPCKKFKPSQVDWGGPFNKSV